jgi:hypothetical protein
MWLVLICGAAIASVAWFFATRRRRSRRLGAISSSIERLTREGHWREARAELEAASSEFPSSTELRSLSERVEQSLRGDVARRLRKLEEEASMGRLDRAEQELRDLESAEYPTQELTALSTRLKELLRREGRARLIRDAEEAAVAGDLDRAQRVLRDLDEAGSPESELLAV